MKFGHMNGVSEKINSDLSSDEKFSLEEIDSTKFGVIDSGSFTDSLNRKRCIEKLVKSLEKDVKENGKPGFSEPANFSKLGHLNLVLRKYTKALSAYQKFFKHQSDYWKDCNFLYGVGIVYFHYNAYQWATRAFQQLLYLYKNFSRTKEVHIYLALIFKITRDYESSLKHFQLALNEPAKADISSFEIQFYIANIYECQGEYLKARDTYEQLINTPDISPRLKSAIYKQLGWVTHTCELFGDSKSRLLLSVDYFKHATHFNPDDGEAFYYLGRCYATLNNVQDAFMSYRHSIDKRESSPDTWCSIGVLYQQQNQPMDALQAFICAVQLDRNHNSAWTNLGILYESRNQPKDALYCFENVLKSKRQLPISLTNHINVIRSQIASYPTIPDKKGELPTIHEAWKLPIPAELTSRQHAAQQAKSNKRAMDANSSFASHCASKKVFTPEQTVDPGGVDQILSDEELMWYKRLQQNSNNLNPQQQEHLRQLHNRMVQHQKSKFLLEKSATYQQQPISVGWPPTQMSSSPPTVAASPVWVNGEVSPQAAKPSVPSRAPTQGVSGYDADISDALSVISALENIDSSTHHSSFNETNSELAVPREAEEVSSSNNTTNQYSFSILPNEKALSLLRKLGCNGVDEGTIYRTAVPPPRVPVVPPLVPPDKLNPPTPTVSLETRREAYHSNLKAFCMALDQPVTVIRGLARALKMDLSLFSTKVLAETNPDHTVEVRTQMNQPTTENWDPTCRHKVWKCESHRTYSNIAKYALYQASSFQESLKDDSRETSEDAMRGKGKRRFKTIKFGTNVDLSDEKRWRNQLQELNKLPPFTRVCHPSNILSHLMYPVLGMNCVQLYMKVPGCRTPGHQENLNFCAININIGPGDCEWFVVDNAYWGVINEMCEKNNVNFLTGSWWPILADLYQRNIPVYRFIQKPGDLVWINSGGVHWVQSIGWCNNIAWNVGPLTAEQYQSSIERYEWNKLQNTRSIVPMITLTWNLVRNVKISTKRVYELMRYTLLKSLKYSELVHEQMKEENIEVKWHGHRTGEAANCCVTCEDEVFNFLYVKEDSNKKWLVHCQRCARRTSPNLKGFVVLLEYRLEDLRSLFDNFKLSTKEEGL